MGLLTVKLTRTRGLVVPAPGDTALRRIPGTARALRGKRPRALVFSSPRPHGAVCPTAEGSVSSTLWELLSVLMTS